MKFLLILLAFAGCTAPKSINLRVDHVFTTEKGVEVYARTGRHWYMATFDTLPSNLKRGIKINALHSDTTGQTIFNALK